MSAEQMQKFKEVVEKSQTVAVRIGITDDISKILAGALLHQAFLKLGKRVNVDIQDGETVSAFFETPLSNFEKEENILIKFDTEKIPVSELRYEQDGKIMKIILKSAGGAGGARPAPDLREVLVEKEALPVDLLMLIDTPETEIENESQNKINEAYKKIDVANIKNVPSIVLLFRDIHWILWAGMLSGLLMSMFVIGLILPAVFNFSSIVSVLRIANPSALLL